MSSKDSLKGDSDNDEADDTDNSLIEQQPLKGSTDDIIKDTATTTKETSRGSTRPRSLHHSRQGNNGTESLSRQGDSTRGCNTPDFAMTQSLYDPSEKRLRQQKQEEECKLMKLMAKEKLSKVALEKKQQELKKRSEQQKVKNEERRQIIEARRQKLEQEKRASSAGLHQSNSRMTSSVWRSRPTNSNQSCSFISSRPVSSTGKIFGFGSSTPRYACEPIRSLSNQRSASTNRSSVCLVDRTVSHNAFSSRMCVSQIVSKSCDTRSFKPVQTKPIVLPKPKKKPKPAATIKPKELKSIHENQSKSSAKLHNLLYDNSKGRSNRQIDKPLASKTDLRTKKNIKTLKKEESKHTKSMHQMKTSKDSESKTTSETKTTDNEDYIKRLNEQRRLAQEKKAKELEEMTKSQEIKLEAEHEQTSSISTDNLEQGQSQTEKETTSTNNIVQEDRSIESKPVIEIPPETDLVHETDQDSNQENSEEVRKEDNTANSCSLSVDTDNNNLLKSELTVSTEDLARNERRKKLDSIMSRIRRTSGSSETLNKPTNEMSGSASILQNMMDKGHLTGMTKTAAILMKNQHNKPADHLNKSNNDNDNSKSEISYREDCDGKEDSPIMKEPPSNTNHEDTKPVNFSMGIWQDKYGLSTSIDTEEASIG